MDTSVNYTSRGQLFLALIFAIATGGMLSGCLWGPSGPSFAAKAASSSSEKSREFLRGMLAEAKAQRSRGIRVGTPESNAAVLAAFEQRCRELLARHEPLQIEQANALEATLDSLQGTVRRYSDEGSASSSTSTTDDSTTTQKCEQKEKEKKCKDHDGDRKKGKDCDERKK